MYYRKAFTLAEVLITLGIIGIVAALTMPSLIAKHQERAIVVKTKKFYSGIANAMNLNLAFDETDYNLDNIVKKFKVVKTCDGPEGCSDDEYYYYNGNRMYYWGKGDRGTNVRYVVLADGTIMREYLQDETCSIVKGTSKQLKHICGEISVDINGHNKPNKIGSDVFYFYLTKYGVIPFGLREETLNDGHNFNADCNYSSPSYGYGCTAWIIEYENQDYLRCKVDYSNGKGCK